MKKHVNSRAQKWVSDQELYGCMKQVPSVRHVWVWEDSDQHFGPKFFAANKTPLWWFKSSCAVPMALLFYKDTSWSVVTSTGNNHHVMFTEDGQAGPSRCTWEQGNRRYMWGCKSSHKANIGQGKLGTQGLLTLSSVEERGNSAFARGCRAIFNLPSLWSSSIHSLGHPSWLSRDSGFSISGLVSCCLHGPPSVPQQPLFSRHIVPAASWEGMGGGPWHVPSASTWRHPKPQEYPKLRWQRLCLLTFTLWGMYCFQRAVGQLEK
jgi:hypothetical protein